MNNNTLKNSMLYNTFTSESVSAGHPDKICDQISDAILDEALKIYPKSRVAIETLVTVNRIIIAGEVTCPKKLDYKNIARNVVKGLGYTKDLFSFTYKSPVSVYVHEQSPDISVGVDEGGAGDQGMMFGFASRETPELMPLPIMLAHRLAQQMDNVRSNGILKYLRPDGKSEVKIVYKNGKPDKVVSVVLAVPHDPEISNEQLKTNLIKKVITPVLTKYKLTVPLADQVIVNGTGRWAIGGPASDTGVTGRKIIVDTYGGYARHGGGCFSGKDPTKVDRSGAYACRYIAKNIVAANLADKCEVRIAYVIGRRDPLDKNIECFGTEKKALRIINDFAWNLLNLSVPGILDGLNLRRPIYQNTASYGHFGRDSFPWEEISNSI